jgi:hypothetical protein
MRGVVWEKNYVFKERVGFYLDISNERKESAKQISSLKKLAMHLPGTLVLPVSYL